MNAERETVRAYLAGVENLDPAGLEIEARYVVTKTQYYRVLRAVRPRGVTTVKIQDETHDQVRHRRIFPVTFPRPNKLVVGTTPSVEEWVRKERIGNAYDSTEFGFRIAKAREKPSPPVTGPVTFANTSLRREVRVTDQIRIDFPKDEKPVRFRIEVELLVPPTPDAIEEFLTWVFKVASLIQGSEIPIGIDERTAVIGYYNLLMNPSDPNQKCLQRQSLPHPEDITMHDLYKGTLLARGRNSFTVKADGETKELLFLDSGIYAVSGKDSVNKLLNTRVKELIPALYQGELVTIPKDGEIGHIYLFVLFETLFTSGQDHRRKSLEERRAFQNILAKTFINYRGLTIIMKEFAIFDSTDTQYAAINSILDSRVVTDKLFGNDGGIFTEVDRPYLRGEVEIKKAKTRKDLTIDFKVTERDLIVANERDKFQDVPFRGSPEAPFTITPEQLQNIIEETEYMEIGDIWEFEFTSDNKAIPRRPREKPSPNKLGTALNVWQLINRPLEEATLRGRDLELMRRYHNVDKKESYDALPDGITLLDLGSGRGGDISKWKRKKFKLYLDEPFANNRQELQRRIKEAHYEKNVLGLVDFGAEETDRIITTLLKGAQVDVVSMMFILTFFFRDSATLDGVLDTAARALRPGGKLLIKTANGARVLEQMRGANRLVTPQYNITRSGGRELLIDIANSIVRDQVEWLTDLTELNLRLQKRGFRLIETHHLDQVQNLPQQQRILSLMYTSLTYEKIGSLAPIPRVLILAPTQQADEEQEPAPAEPARPESVRPARPDSGRVATINLADVFAQL